MIDSAFICRHKIFNQLPGEKWARQFEVRENDSSTDKQSKKEGGGGWSKPETRACLVRNEESEKGILLQNYAIPRNSDNACFMSYYRDKMIAIIFFLSDKLSDHLSMC